jgi:hypothetical protein
MPLRLALFALAVVGLACGGGKASNNTGQGGLGGSGVPPTNLPVVVSFKAEPAILPMAGGSAMLTWEVMNADSVSIDHGVGTVSGTSTTVNITTSTIYTLTATNGNGSVQAVAAIGVGQNPATGSNSRYAAMVSPTGGEQFTAPATLRLIAAAHDPLVYNNTPTDGHGGNASVVQFFVDDTMVLSVDGLEAEYWVFKGYASGIAAGQHRVWSRAIYVDPPEQLDSIPRIINVSAPPAYSNTVDLTADVTVGSQGYSLVGTAGGRVRLNGHGHRIVSGGSAGAVTLQFVDIFDLGGAAETDTSAIDVTTSALIVEDCNFDTSNTVMFDLGGSATASVKRNTFRSNMRMRIGQQPEGPESFPVVVFSGASSGAKAFAGNNVAASWVAFDGARNWVVGGDSDADSNVLIGPRVGIQLMGGSGMQVRRNYSHHVYYGGWSQGANFELGGSPTVEHNVIYGSSWPVRGVNGEFRYNLVLEAGHEWLWPESNGSIHHNVFSAGENDVGGIFLAYNYTGIKIVNNTLDGFQGWNSGIEAQDGSMAVTSNAFVNAPSGASVNLAGGTVTADYNFFDNATNNYSDGRRPTHDVFGSDAMLTNPPTQTFDIDETVIWQRGTTVAGVLGIYRMRYLPRTGSPLIDVGDPAGGAGNDIGAVGAGTANTNDRFGLP